MYADLKFKPTQEERAAQRAADLELQIQKLPQWAQKEIAYLRGNNQRLATEIAEIKEGSKNGSNDFGYRLLGDGASGPRVMLPQYASLSAFGDDDSTTLALSVATERSGKWLEVRALIGNYVVVKPGCSNVVAIQSMAL